ncbi:MAG: hypothetical protein LBR73_04575 [Oscillospiraceae bacterium]|jgi:hypothetical protein|nr:hypothetical protein [Oscillospiraceae bacterium]
MSAIDTVNAKFLLYCPLSAAEQSAAEDLCAESYARIQARLHSPEDDAEDDRVLQCAALEAAYDWVCRKCLEQLKRPAFRAGDITVASPDYLRAFDMIYRLWHIALDDAAPLLKDPAFYAESV